MTTYTTLVSAVVLERHLDDPEWVIFDCRHDLARHTYGRAQFLEAHIPGAHFLDAESDFSGVKGAHTGRHPLPDPAAFAAKLGALGVDETKQVVTYDAHGGVFAARVWWMLRWLGHDAAAVLDGGYDEWLREGRRVSSAVPPPAPKRFVPQPRPVHVDTAFVQANLAGGRARVIDARAPDRYRGDNETLDPVGGHIPGAVNRFYKDNLDATGRFKPAEQLAQEWRAILGGVAPERIVHSCGSGVSACHNALAMEIAGLRGSFLYPGSWSEWCAEPTRPIATGSAP
jgi:thiosulfate/3-mercaptopyruvate sulfurtransferase